VLLALLRLLVSPVAIVLVTVIILVPMVRTVFDVFDAAFTRRDFHESVEIVRIIAVIMIGWGVALEERHVIRKVFRIAGGPDETWQARIDDICHRFGVGSLVLGLFAEVSVDLIALPDRIADARGKEHMLLAVGAGLIALAAVLFVRHILVLLANWRPRDEAEAEA
jgi:hypothetical protein